MAISDVDLTFDSSPNVPMSINASPRDLQHWFAVRQLIWTAHEAVKRASKRDLKSVIEQARSRLWSLGTSVYSALDGQADNRSTLLREIARGLQIWTAVSEKTECVFCTSTMLLCPAPRVRRGH